MTISSATRKAGPYTGNDVTTSFPFTFKVFAAADLTVVRLEGGVETELTLNSHYSVTLNADQNANPGGSITYPISGAPLTPDQQLTIGGDLGFTFPYCAQYAVIQLAVRVVRAQFAGESETQVSDAIPGMLPVVDAYQRFRFEIVGGFFQGFTDRCIYNGLVLFQMACRLVKAVAPVSSLFH